MENQPLPVQQARMMASAGLATQTMAASQKLAIPGRTTRAGRRRGTLDQTYAMRATRQCKAGTCHER
jgi:hypothetical protein